MAIYAASSGGGFLMVLLIAGLLIAAAVGSENNQSNKNENDRLRRDAEKRTSEQKAVNALLKVQIMKALDEDAFYVNDLIADAELNDAELPPAQVEWLYAVEAEWEAIHENDDDEWLDADEITPQDPRKADRWTGASETDAPLGRTEPTNGRPRPDGRY